jgi:MOSC domain-containing protein YiiM
VYDSIKLTDLGLEGDFQVDRRVHGGLEKALHHYNADNYTTLTDAFAHLSGKFIPGSIGENISTKGMSEEQVNIGDIFEFGEAIIQVSQPRKPCW